MKMRALLTVLMLAGLVQAQQSPLQGIAHVGYRVHDLERSGAFYTAILGLRLAFKSTDGAVFYRVNENQYLEFVPGLGAQDNVRLTHIAFATTDVQGLRRLLQSHGIVAPEVARDSAGELSFSIGAPEGTRIDFVQPIHRTSRDG